MSFISKNYFTLGFCFNIKKSNSCFVILFNVLYWKAKKITPSTIHTTNAIYDGVDNAAGDDGINNSAKNTNEMIAPSAPNTTYTVFLFCGWLKNFTATILVAKNAIDTPTDDMSTIHDNAVRPNHGAASVTISTKITAMYGVLNVGCNFANASGINFARPNANVNLDDDK